MRAQRACHRKVAFRRASVVRTQMFVLLVGRKMYLSSAGLDCKHLVLPVAIARGLCGMLSRKISRFRTAASSADGKIGEKLISSLQPSAVLDCGVLDLLSRIWDAVHLFAVFFVRSQPPQTRFCLIEEVCVFVPARFNVAGIFLASRDAGLGRFLLRECMDLPVRSGSAEALVQLAERWKGWVPVCGKAGGTTLEIRGDLRSRPLAPACLGGDAFLLT